MCNFKGNLVLYGPFGELHMNTSNADGKLMRTVTYKLYVLVGTLGVCRNLDG